MERTKGEKLSLPHPLPSPHLKALEREPWERGCSLGCHVSKCRVTQSLETQAYPTQTKEPFRNVNLQKLKFLAAFKLHESKNYGG